MAFIEPMHRNKTNITYFIFPYIPVYIQANLEDAIVKEALKTVSHTFMYWIFLPE